MPDTAHITLPPHNQEAEEAVLGSLLIDPAAIPTILPLLQPDDFYFQKNGWVFQAILDLHEAHEPVDFVTLSDRLEAQDRLTEVGGTAHLSHLINAVPSAIHASSYARLVRETAVRRRVLAASSDAARLAYDLDTPLDDLLDRTEAAFLQLRGQVAFQDRLRPLDAVLDRVYADLETAYRDGAALGIPTGFPDLDRLLGGLRPGNLLIVGARPSVGKSALLISFATHAARLGVPSVIFSLEMAAASIAYRLLTMQTGVDVLRLQSGQLKDDEWPAITQATGELASHPLWVDDTPHLTITDLRAKARRLYAEHGLGLLLLDYIQLAHASRRYDSRYREIGEITRELKELAKELGIPIVAASQVSRAVEQRTDKRPTLADLRESGNQEADADGVIFIHNADETASELIVAKNRNGETGTAYVLWQPHRARFVSLARQTQSSPP